MAFTTPPNAFSLSLSRSSTGRPAALTTQCPVRPTNPTTSTPLRHLQRPTHIPPTMTSGPNNPSRQQQEQQPSDQNQTTPSWTTKVLRAARVLGISAAAAVAAAATPPLASNLSARRADTQPACIMLDSAIAAPQYSKKTLSEKLSQVPVFAVTNASGQPYLANMDGSGSQVGLIFFSHLDALNMLKDMQKNPGASDARVYIMGLDKAYEMVKAKPTPSGIRGSSGEELTMVFRFYPDSKQVKAAEGLARKLRLRGGVDGVPVFVAKGLTLRKGGENVVPLFLTKEDLDAAWAKLRESNKELPGNAQVVVGNLLFIIQQMENGETPELNNMGFFAPRASVDYVAKEQAGPVGQARLHQNPVNAPK